MPTTPENLQAHRQFFANLVTANAGIPPGSELAAAFASTPREQFVGPPPWKIFTPVGYIATLSDDPTFLYQDVVVSLGTDAPLNNGQPTLHAFCIAALAPKKGEKVVHIGAGTGYYTTLLAKLVGDSGTVDGYEIEPELAQRAITNLAPLRQVILHARSGTEGPLPPCDILYVNAGATEPLSAWLDALRPNGRLLFPMTPAAGAGAMLLITRQEDHTYAASFLVQAQFVPCVGARIETTAQRLTEAFRNENWSKIKSLHRNDTPDDTCWCSGPGWWLSTT
ncbi:protein-L-isoaspartate(D-aspartate) O-methyltransferase [Granulicella sp. dw_53]|uniref:protein-L-isoaspartate O-methyltransferase family protein n=1 Tax=Granulicella sp. dw_53 TaxID=2719792 RepID=UPI001BD1D316|nr:protein-L-isoaspartate(D-aspartate) O-methyltransferase [Granulicella sp. dw_53]